MAINKMKDYDKEWTSIDGDNTLRLDYPLNKKSIVVDVGGYHGDWSAKIYDKYKCKIWIFEPFFNIELSRRFYNNDNITVVGGGLGPVECIKVFGENRDSTSTFKVTGNMVRCNVFGIDYFNDFDIIDLIKINIEGMEYDLLDAILDRGIIKKFKNIQVQFHNFVVRAKDRRRRIRKRLSGTHKEIYNFPFVWESWKIFDK